MDNPFTRNVSIVFLMTIKDWILYINAYDGSELNCVKPIGIEINRISLE